MRDRFDPEGVLNQKKIQMKVCLLRCKDFVLKITECAMERERCGREISRQFMTVTIKAEVGESSSSLHDRFCIEVLVA